MTAGATPPPPTTPRARTDYRWLLFVCVVAALSHGGWSFFHPDPGLEEGVDQSEPLVLRGRSPDEREYVNLATRLADEGEFRLPSGDRAKRMPLYPLFLSLIYKTQPQEYWNSSIVLAQAFLGWCTTLGIAMIAFRLRNATAGAIAGLISAIYAPYLYVETLYLTETLALALFVAAVLIYVFTLTGNGGSGRRTLSVAGVSILVGLMALTRADAIVLVIPFAVHAYLVGLSRKERVARALAASVPVVLIAGFWSYRNSQEVGRFTLSTIGGLNFYLGQHEGFAANSGLDRADYGAFDELRRQGLSEVAADRALFDRGLSFCREHPGEAIGNCFRKFRIWFTPSIASYGPLLLVLITGFICASAWTTPVSIRTGRRKEHRVATVALVLAVLAYLVHYKTSTRVMPFVSPVHVLALGIPSLLLLRTRTPVRGLFLGLFATQMLVAVAFIPISRLRWTMDSLLIVALAIGVSRVCTRLRLPVESAVKPAGDSP